MADSLGPERTRSYLDGMEANTNITAINWPNSITLSGEPEAIEKFSQVVKEQEVSSVTLKEELMVTSGVTSNPRSALLAPKLELAWRRPELNFRIVRELFDVASMLTLTSNLPWIEGVAYLMMIIEAASQMHYEAEDAATVKSFKYRPVATNSEFRVEDTELGVETVLDVETLPMSVKEPELILVRYGVTDALPQFRGGNGLVFQTLDILQNPASQGFGVYSFDLIIVVDAHLAPLSKGESIPIQSAIGSLGMAVIQIAQHIGAKIYATMGTDDKRKVLTKEFGIPPDRIFNSRTLSMVKDILQATRQQGLDVILNSIGGDLMHETPRCIAPLGRFIDVGRTDVLGGARLGLEVFERNATSPSFDTGLLYRQKPSLISRCGPSSLSPKRNSQDIG
ncbi:hypothetical protein GGR58DRAFT_506361 [Xylaria digitata]|nr:hypothetical protein GGR58DRAFT_506361 [Xylaria digitata]